MENHSVSIHNKYSEVILIITATPGCMRQDTPHSPDSRAVVGIILLRPERSSNGNGFPRYIAYGCVSFWRSYPPLLSIAWYITGIILKSHTTGGGATSWLWPCNTSQVMYAGRAGNEYRVTHHPRQTGSAAWCLFSSALLARVVWSYINDYLPGRADQSGRTLITGAARFLTGLSHKQPSVTAGAAA